jgi:hypothetical protein
MPVMTNASLVLIPTVVVDEDKNNIPTTASKKKCFGSLRAGLLSQYFFMTLKEDSKRVGVVRYNNLFQNDMLVQAEVSSEILLLFLLFLLLYYYLYYYQFNIYI